MALELLMCQVRFVGTNWRLPTQRRPAISIPAMFGWGKDVQEFGPMEYTMFTNDSRPAGGMFKITPEMGKIPPHWLVYFAVDDCDG